MFCIFLFVFELTHLTWHQMSKFPDFNGFWEFPKDPKVIPIYIQNSQELGKFAVSSHTASKICIFLLFVVFTCGEAEQVYKSPGKIWRMFPPEGLNLLTISYVISHESLNLLKMTFQVYLSLKVQKKAKPTK